MVPVKITAVTENIQKPLLISPIAWGGYRRGGESAQAMGLRIWLSKSFRRR
jgi:hypothetical protein